MLLAIECKAGMSMRIGFVWRTDAMGSIWPRGAVGNGATACPVRYAKPFAFPAKGTTG